MDGVRNVLVAVVPYSTFCVGDAYFHIQFGVITSGTIDKGRSFLLFPRSLATSGEIFYNWLRTVFQQMFGEYIYIYWSFSLSAVQYLRKICPCFHIFSSVTWPVLLHVGTKAPITFLSYHIQFVSFVVLLLEQDWRSKLYNQLTQWMLVAGSGRLEVADNVGHTQAWFPRLDYKSALKAHFPTL